MRRHLSWARALLLYLLVLGAVSAVLLLAIYSKGHTP
jgi:hypothetical protein